MDTYKVGTPMIETVMTVSLTVGISAVVAIGAILFGIGAGIIKF